MVSLSQALRLIGDYARDRLLAQLKAVAPIVLYLVLFQVLVLGIPVAQASLIAAGLGLVVLGLAFFMEGLLLGLMPLGELIGLKLPQRAGLALMLLFAFLLGVGSTFAEPAIGVLRAAGSAIRPWDAPLLFLLLNDYADWLVYSVGIGVGVAVLFGMLRFIYHWSLKPFIYALVGITAGLTVWSHFDPNLVYVIGLAWDCGAVTTGPVTVPLVLALGIGVSRVLGSGSGDSQGFGVVTLASLFPILAVLVLGLVLAGRAPLPMTQAQFFAPEQRQAALALFGEEPARLAGYAFLNGSAADQAALFGGEAQALEALRALVADPPQRQRAFGDGFAGWLSERASPAQRQAVAEVGAAPAAAAGSDAMAALTGRALPNATMALQAILPLTLFLLVVLKLVLRFRLPRPDEFALGIAFALIGMSLFNLGIELGLAKLGDQVGRQLPSAYASLEQPEARRVVEGFDRGLVQQALGPDGKPESFFFAREGAGYVALPFDEARLEADGRYVHLPRLGPMFEGERGLILGIGLVLIFAFVTGYAATLAEPALNALGLTVEKVTGGSFRKGLLIQAVAVGVGLGLLLGVAKIIWDLPLMWLLVPPYLLLLAITHVSSEEFVNIGWDAAGVTTGPITVPLVLALGLGIGGQAGVVEGFGILAMASLCPIMSVLCVGLFVTWRHKRQLALASPAAEASLPLRDQAV